MESEVGRLAGQMALLLGLRPSELLGLECSELRRFLIDAALLAKALEEAAAPEEARSTKELVRRKRAKWQPPARRWAARWL